MTDALDAAERKAHEACPCSDCDCPNSTSCCVEDEGDGRHDNCCAQTHYFIRDLRREAFNAGLEAAARALPGSFAAMIRSLAAKETSDGR